MFDHSIGHSRYDMLFHFWTFFNETKSTTWISWDTNTNMCVLVYMQYCFAPIHQEKCLHFNWSTSERLSSLILGPKFEGLCSPNPIFRNELRPSLTLIWVSMVLNLMSTVCTLIRTGKITDPISWQTLKTSVWSIHRQKWLILLLLHIYGSW